MFATRKLLILSVSLAAATALTIPSSASATSSKGGNHAHLLVSGLHGSVGSTVGPDGALYVPESATGSIARINPRTGHVSTFATGLPKRIGDLGGAMDVAFIHHTAYVLVTLVSPDVGGTDVDGIYRMDGPHTFTVVADIGAWAIAHPPVPAFVVPSGVQYAMQPYRRGFLVTDGHHNRVLRVTLGGAISEVIAFGDIVPTGLAVRGHKVFMAEAGPVPHLPKNGKVVTFRTHSPTARLVAKGAPLLVDVEFGRGRLYALSQGYFVPGGPEGSPASPDTGALERVHHDGTMTPVVTGLDRPTSLEFIGGRAYVITLTGEVWVIRHIRH